MKTYEIPYSGSGGPGDSWSSYVTVELSDEQAERLAASIDSEKYDDFEDDSSLSDIYNLVWEKMVDQNMDSWKYDPDYLRSFGKKKDSLRTCAEKMLESNCATIHYPRKDPWF